MKYYISEYPNFHQLNVYYCAGWPQQTLLARPWKDIFKLLILLLVCFLLPIFISCGTYVTLICHRNQDRTKVGISGGRETQSQSPTNQTIHTVSTYLNPDHRLSMVARTRDKIFEDGIFRIDEISENDDFADDQKGIEDVQCICQDDKQLSLVSSGSSFEHISHERIVQIVAEIHNEEFNSVPTECQSSENNPEQIGT